MAALAQEAGIPSGVFNVITGNSSQIGAELTGDPRVRKISFTGSTAVGKQLMAQCASTVKRLSLELGGNAPLIVFDDADLDKAVEGALGSKFRNSGQTCICANRILVQNGIFDAFIRRLATKVDLLKSGNGLDAGTTQGPLIDRSAVDHVDALVKDAVGKGARVLVGGKPHALGGLYYEPTVLVGVKPNMRVFREEIFGPVAPVVSFTSEKEAIALANDTEVGPGFVRVHLRPGAHLAHERGLGVRHGRNQRSHAGHDRSALRGHQGKRHGPGRRQRGAYGLHGHEVHPDGRDRGIESLRGGAFVPLPKRVLLYQSQVRRHCSGLRFSNPTGKMRITHIRGTNGARGRTRTGTTLSDQRRGPEPPSPNGADGWYILTQSGLRAGSFFPIASTC